MVKRWTVIPASKKKKKLKHSINLLMFANKYETTISAKSNFPKCFQLYCCSSIIFIRAHLMDVPSNNELSAHTKKSVDVS